MAKLKSTTPRGRKTKERARPRPQSLRVQEVEVLVDRPPLLEIATTRLSNAFHQLGSLLAFKASPAAQTAKIVQALEALSSLQEVVCCPHPPKIDWQGMADRGPSNWAIGERFELEQARKALARWEERLAKQELATKGGAA